MSRWTLHVLIGLRVSCSAVGAPALPEAVTGGPGNVIPTPQFIETRSGNMTLVGDGARRVAILVSEHAAPQERVAAGHLRDRIAAISGVELPIRQTASDDVAVIAIGSWESKTMPDEMIAILSADDRAFLRRDGGTRQDYVIDCGLRQGRQVAVLCGTGPEGALYATMTFMHTLAKSEGRVAAPRVHVRDLPDVEYRWFFPRNLGKPERAIEFAMEHKVNLITAFQYYHFTFSNAEEQLRLNRYARDRGVKLLHLMMGDLGLKNRRHYPDGPTYKCLYEGEPSERAYCLSNPALIAEKQRIVREFVDAVEPGCLYVHFVDEDDYRDADEVWSNRCPQCRKRWPNDVIETPDGKAGAQAMIFDKMAEAIFSVKHPESGYDAARDCLVIFVSAPYTLWAEPDEIWQKEVIYHTTVSRLMKHVSNVHFCMRENRLCADGTKRTAALAEALRTHGNGHGVMMYYLGGDRRHNLSQYPVRHGQHRNFSCAPIMMKSFEGCRSTLITGSAHFLIKAEYAWNMESTGFYVDPKTQEEWGATFRAIIGDRLRPPEIYGEGGFVERALAHLYGQSSAKPMRSAYVPAVYEEGVPPILPPIGRGWFTYCQMVRAAHDRPDLCRKWAKLYAAYGTAADAAIPKVERCLGAPDFRPRNRWHTEQLLFDLRYGKALARLAQNEALWLAEAGDSQNAKAVEHRDAMRHGLSELLRLARGNTDSSRRKQYVDFASSVAEAAERRAKSFEKVRQQLAHLNEQKKHILANLDAERQRTLTALSLDERTRVDDDLAQLRNARIALVGSTSVVRGLLEAKGSEQVQTIRGRRLPEDLSAYRVICLLHTMPRLKWEDILRLHEFVENGGGVLMTCAAPFYVAGNRTDLGAIAAFLGAEHYGNSTGPMKVLHGCYLTQDLPSHEGFRAPGSAACVRTPLAGVPVMCYRSNSRLISVLANTFGKGRCVYLWKGIGDEANPKEHEKLFLRTLCWLAGAQSGPTKAAQ